MRRETEPKSPILSVCTTLEEQIEGPWNNDLLPSAIKGAEPRRNQLFLGSSTVLLPQHSSAGTNCVLWEEKGRITLLHGCAWFQPPAPGVPSWSHGSVLGLHSWAGEPHWGVWVQVGQQTGWQGYLCTCPAPGAAGAVFGTEGLSRVKLLIEQMLALGPVSCRISPAAKTRPVQKVGWHFLTSLLSYSCLFMQERCLFIHSGILL